MSAIEELMRQAADRASATSGPGLSYEERRSGSQAPALYGSRSLVVFPVPRGAVRELVDSVRGHAGRAARRVRRAARRDLARAGQRRVFPGRPADDVGLSAKNAILIVEFAEDLARSEARS